MIGDSVLTFVQPEDFIYGPSHDNSVRNLAELCGCFELNDLDNDECLGMDELSEKVIMRSVSHNYKIIFDITHVDDLENILQNKGPYANLATSKELRFIKEHYNFLQNNVIFIKELKEVARPW